MAQKIWIATLATALIFGTSISMAATLDVKTGLWEMTSSGETTGMPPVPPEVMAKMTPEQQARMKAAMAQSSQPHTNKVCVSEKSLQRGFNLNTPKEANCKRDVLTSTSRQVDVRMECIGETKMNGTFHIEAVDRQTLRGNFDMVMSRDTNTMTMKRTLQGKWLGSDCGSVKPEEE